MPAHRWARLQGPAGRLCLAASLREGAAPSGATGSGEDLQAHYNGMLSHQGAGDSEMAKRHEALVGAQP
jgi:hypothetical protein